MKHSTRTPTKAEDARIKAVRAMPCLACEIEDDFPQPLPTEAHHLVDKGTRKHSGGHMATIPLCGWHHRGEPAGTHYKSEMKVLYGPSLALHKREFVAAYGTERQLLEKTNERLEEDKAA